MCVCVLERGGSRYTSVTEDRNVKSENNAELYSRLGRNTIAHVQNLGKSIFKGQEN